MLFGADCDDVNRRNVKQLRSENNKFYNNENEPMNCIEAEIGKETKNMNFGVLMMGLDFDNKVASNVLGIGRVVNYLNQRYFVFLAFFCKHIQNFH
jgi:hypothetical protein